MNFLFSLWIIILVLHSQVVYYIVFYVLLSSSERFGDALLIDYRISDIVLIATSFLDVRETLICLSPMRCLELETSLVRET